MVPVQAYNNISISVFEDIRVNSKLLNDEHPSKFISPLKRGNARVQNPPIDESLPGIISKVSSSTKEIQETFPPHHRPNYYFGDNELYNNCRETAENTPDIVSVRISFTAKLFFIP